MDFFRAVGAFILKVMASDGFQIAMTVLTLGVGVKGYMQAKDMLAKGQDIMANKIAAGGKIPVIYGSRRVGAQIVYMDTAGNSSTHLYVVYALSVGECEEIMGETIELSGNSLRDSKQFRNGGYIGSDKISSGSGSLCTANQNSGSVDLTGGTFGTNPALGGYRYVMNLHHGAASQAADPMLRASIGSKWTTAHKLNGVAYIAASYIYDSKGQFRGVPQLTVQVKGKKVFDPRDNSTAWSSNPALCFLDLIQNNDYGKGLATSQINMATFSAAANKADTEVNSPYFNGSAKALTWSGSSGDNFIKVLGGSANVMWWQNKVSELMDVYDANGNGVIDGKEITALQRNEFFSENPEYIVFFNGTLGGNYSSQSGSSLIKSKRFHCNAYIDCNKTVMENSKELLSNMRGIFNYVDGKYELQIEDTGSSTFSINDNHIIADSGISVDYGNKDKKANKVVVEFFNANKRYEMDTATVYHEATTDSNDYTSDDGGEVLELKVEFPHTTSAYIAYNHAKTILVRSRHQTTIQFLGTPEMYKLNVGDITNLTYAPLGFSGKTFRVEALELQPSGLVAVSMLEYFDVYTWTVPPQEAVEALANVPSAYAVKAPTSLAFTDTDNSNTSRPFLAWALPTDYPYYQWRVNVKDSSGNQQINRIVDVNNCDLNFLPVDANYVANITALNSVGVESTATALTFTVGDAPTGTPDIKDGAITNVKVLNLSAAKINTGELNLGTAAGMSVRQNKTGYSSNAAGFWLGNDGGTAKFNIGNSSSFLRWDGSALNIAGSIAATTGVIGGFTVGSNSLIAGSGTSRISLSTAAGIHLGNNTFGSAPFRVSLAGALVATNANISGAITASSLNVTNATITGTLDASVITLNGEPLSNLMSYSSSGTGSITLLEVANIDGDFVVNGNFEATGSQPDLVIGKVYNVSDANDRTIQADARLVSANGDASFKIQSQTHNNATLTTKASFSYTAFGNTASLGTAGTLKINSGNALSLTLDTSQNATFTGEVTADAIQLPVQTPSSTTNKIYNVGGALYFNGAAVGGGGAGDITAVVAGTNLTGGGTSGSVTLNLANTISISGTIASGAITSSGNLLIDSDNAEINLKSGVGTTSGAVNWTFNSTGTDFASIKLPYATRATKGLWIDSGYPITIDATTRIDFDIIGSTKMDLDGSGLSVAGSITSGTIIVTSDNSYFRDNDNVGIYLQTTAQGTGNNDGVRVGLNGTHAFVWNYEAKPLAFATSGTERLSIGATGLFDFKANNITNIGTIASGGITSSGFITGTRLRVGDGTDGYFYSDTAGRTAFRSGEFYIQDTVPTYYNYATNQYHGASSGDNHYFRGNPLSGNNWSIPASGAATFAGRTIMGGDGARVQIANSTAADSSNLYTLAVGSQSGNKSILAARDINTTAGGYQINGTTVIDTARNISAGAITASGLIRSNSSNYYGNASTAVNYRGYGDTPIMSGVSGATYLYAGGSGSVCLTLQSSRTIAPQLAIGQVNNFTTVIDASRNMSNIGTITATGNLSAAGQLLGRGFRAGNRGELHINAVGAGDVAEIFFGYGDGFTEANLRWGISDRGTTNDQLIIYRAPALGGFTAVATFDASEMTLAVANGYKVGTTSVIDAARNITSSQLYIGSWTPSNATSIGRIGKVTDRPAGSITNQLGTNANSVWEIVDYDWTVVLAKVTDAGNFTASGNVTAFSDQRLKTNIQTLDPKLALKMRGVSFTKDEKQGSGVIAQEIEKIAPELVLTADDEIGTKSVAYGNLVGYLIETVKDQQKQIDELKELIGAA